MLSTGGGGGMSNCFSRLSAASRGDVTCQTSPWGVNNRARTAPKGYVAGVEAHGVCVANRAERCGGAGVSPCICAAGLECVRRPDLATGSICSP
jgi:hypothetical protein